MKIRYIAFIFSVSLNVVAGPTKAKTYAEAEELGAKLGEALKRHMYLA